MGDGGTWSARGLVRRPSPTALAGLVIAVAVVVLNLRQQPGRITFDTKLDLQFNPDDLLVRSLSLWNGDWALGGLQNQASGYLFPMGPVFWAGELVGVPVWVWERLWSAAVMLLAYEGARRLARSWPGVGTAGAVLAGAAYMLAPRVLTTVGGLSGETLPGAVLPWTVLPLVLYLRGRLDARAAFLFSAATVPWMGGQNATLVAACLVLPALLLVLVDGRGWRRRASDLATWSGLVLLVSAWWWIPLLILGGYAPPFLDFIESSRNTAGAPGWLSSLRGTSHWVAFFPDGGTLGWVGGYALASSMLLLPTTVVVAAGGLVGLCLRSTWQRRVLLSIAVVGLAVLTAGSGALAGSVLSEWWLDALDSALAPLRNVHKFDPIVRLPLCLGLGALVTAMPRAWWSPRLGRAIPAHTLCLVTIALAVLAATLPAVTGSLRSADGMDDVSSGWRQAARYLDDLPGPVRTMVLPGTGFAVQVWGRTIDEPIQVLDAPPWLARAQVTVAPGGTLRLLDSVEESVVRARPQQSLAASFDRLGMTHVVVRHDLDAAHADAPSPDVVQAGVAATPGLRRVAGFGREVDGRRDIEVYAVPTTSDPRINVSDWGSRRRVSGGPEAVDDLVAAGLLLADQATVLVGGDERADIVTDSNQRVERSFGRVHGTVSGVMTAQDRFRVERREHDFTDVNVPHEQTTALYEGAQDIVASSSGGYADVLGPVRPEEHPYAAFDASAFTGWTNAPLSNPEGQWVEARFGSPLDPGPVSLTFDHFKGDVVHAARLSTDGGDIEVEVAEDGSAREVRLPGGLTSTLRITVLDVEGSQQQFRLADVGMENHEIRRALRPPGRVDATSAVHLSVEEPQRACSTTPQGLSCDQTRQFETPETAGFDRTLTVTQDGSWDVAGRVIATNGPALGSLFAPLDPRRVLVTATSTYAGDPAVVSANAFDGRPETSWYASPLDPAPALALSWAEERTISSVRAQLAEGQPGRLPAALVIDPMNGRDDPQLVATTGPGAGTLEPVRTNRLRISSSGGTGSDGVGISELQIDGLDDLKNRVSLDSPSGTACGFGPTVAADGRVVHTRVVGTLDDVVTGRELELRACDGSSLDIDRGTKRLRVTNPAGFVVTDLWLTPPGWAAAADATEPRAEVMRWGDTDRTIDVTSDDQSVLSFAESANVGWTASVDGSRLEPMVIDGWKQAWVLPAGTDGPVRAQYEPQTGFLVSIVGGLVMAGLISLVALAMLVGVSRTGASSSMEPIGSGRHLAVSAPGSPFPPRIARVARPAGLLGLTLISLPLVVGAIIGWASKRVTLLAAALAGIGALGVAVVLTVLGTTAVSPPVGADVLTALVVGAVVGRVLGGPPRGGRS